MLNFHPSLSTPVVRCLATVVLIAFAQTTFAAEIDGFTEPYRDIDVAAAEMGRVVHLDVREGDRVAQGQLLALLDDDVISATREIAKASMEASGRLEAALAELHMLEESLAQLQVLLLRNHATQREVDRAAAQKEMADARVKAAREELGIKALEFDRTCTQLDQRRVMSPIGGLVTQLYKDEGEFVSPNDPVIIRIVQIDPLLVVFSVPLAKISTLASGESVDVRIESPRKKVQGIVEFISPTADAQSGTTRVHVRIPNPDELIASGVTCHLVLPEGTK